MQNAFSEVVSNVFTLLVVDLMHEFELGVWKAVFVHLIRILEASPGNLVDRLDAKYMLSSSHTLLIATRLITLVSDVYLALVHSQYESSLQMCLR